MTPEEQEQPLGLEETLDPEDWEATRALAHRMVDEMLDHVATIRERPPWRHMTAEAKARFRVPVPREPSTPEAVYEEFLSDVLPWPMGATHPRFWGWVIGTGTYTGALAEFLAAIMNPNLGGGDHHAANHVEHQVIQWVKEMLGYPAEASGVLTSGGSASNLVGLAVARNHASHSDMRTQGVRGCPRPLAFYASTEAHSSIDKGLIVLGLGTASLHTIPSGDDFGIDVAALAERIARDRAEGWEPACVVGCAGTTDTGAFDDLAALADLCEREGLWFHVDGAFGAWAALAPETRHLVAGMERADSLALDLHKWMYMPYEIGCVLVRDEVVHRESFGVHPAYLAHADPGASGRGIAGGDLPWFSDYSVQLSRGFRALKAWMSIKEHGVERYGRLVAQNVAQARYLAGLVEADPELELVAPVPLNVVAYRYVRPGMDDADLDSASLDALNRRILAELQEQGIAVPTGSTVRGHAVIHVAITNHRTRREDLALLARETVRLGRELG